MKLPWTIAAFGAAFAGIAFAPQAAIAQSAEDVWAESLLPEGPHEYLKDDPHSEDGVDTGVHFQRITVAVSLNGKGPYPFLIDTGAERTVLSSRTALELGLITEGTAKLVGAIGTAEVTKVRIDTLDLGRERLENISALVLEEADVGAAGILGIDALRDHRVTFHFDNERITIGRLGQANRHYDVVIGGKARSDRMILSHAWLDGVRVKVIIDTGSNVTIGNPALAKRLRRGGFIGEAMIRDVTGASHKAPVIGAQYFNIGDLGFRNTYLVIAPSPAFTTLGLDDEPAILLGMNFLRAFKRVAVDFRSRSIAFDLKG